MRLRRLLPAALVLAAVVGLWTWRDAAGPSSEPAAAPRTAEPAADAPATLAGRSATSPPVAVPEKVGPWWIERRVVSIDPAVRSARLEAWWWSVRPALDRLVEPEAVFTTEEIDLSKGTVTVRVTGNDQPGHVVLYVVEGERRRRADLYTDPRSQVAPPYGYGPAYETDLFGTVVAGARDLSLVALASDDRPVAGLEVDVRDVHSPRMWQRARTDEQGRVTFGGMRGTKAIVSWTARHGVVSLPDRGHGLVAEFTDGEARTVVVEEKDVVLRVPRNPWLRLRVRVEGAPPDAWCPVQEVRIDRGPGSGQAHDAAHGFSLPPGAWRGWTYVYPVGDLSFETPTLALDTETTLDVSTAVPAKQGWLDVSFDVGQPSESDRLGCAVEVRSHPSRGGWSGTQRAAPHHRVLLFPLPEEVELTGAIRTGATVRMSKGQRLSLAAGERLSITLATSPAGGVTIPATGTQDWNVRWSLVERDFPTTGVVEDGGFRFAWIGNRSRATTWWMPPGRYTLRRREDDAGLSTGGLSIEVKPGEMRTISEGESRAASERR